MLFEIEELSLYISKNLFTDVSRVLRNAITDHQMGHVTCPFVLHHRIRSMYTWQNVATKTETVRKKFRKFFLYFEFMNYDFGLSKFKFVIISNFDL